MKRTVFLLFIVTRSFAQSPGMWLPNNIDSVAWLDMKSSGLQLTQKDVYDETSPSLKDAVVMFGGGCTAEFISGEGLLVTNHHCGLGAVQALSSVEHDYIGNGYWAKNKSEEKPCGGVNVTRIVKIKDVSEIINHLLPNTLTETQRQRRIDSIGQRLTLQEITGSHYGAYVRPFYNGNQFVLFVTETFNDVRLVGVPPISIGDFGGETDNWVYPRHTGDFTLFRVYANANNAPSDYSTSNTPYKPLKFLPISLRGVNENDFTMVYGFPGRTTQYLSASAVDLIQNVTDPIRVEARTARLRAWDALMKTNDTVRIQYQAKYNGLANGWKKWQGEIKGLRETNTVTWKKMQDTDFDARAAAHHRYETLLPQLDAVYDSLKTIYKPVLYDNEILETAEAFQVINTVEPMLIALKSKSPDTDSLSKKIKTQLVSFYKNYSPRADRAAYTSVLTYYATHVPASQQEPYVAHQLAKYHGNATEFVNTLYDKSMFDNEAATMTWINDFKHANVKKLLKDPMYLFYSNVKSYYNTNLSEPIDQLQARANALNRIYMQAQLELFPETHFFPDANSTLRITYGKANGYTARDGVRYDYFTTSNGILEKNSFGLDDYTLKDDYKKLLQSKDFGSYAAPDGLLHTDFIAGNHTTGGNSGSPVLNVRGEFIGINFDRVWEGTMSDIRFMPDRCRNIALDARYMLFVVDRYCGAGYLLKEMEIRR